MKKVIHISIAFGDAILPVIDCDDGHQRVPLKPIADQVGVNWETYKRRLAPEKYLARRLGVNLTPSRGCQKPQIHIRIDRVTAFLNTLNPEKVRSKGNVDTADWLEAKHSEWDDVLHRYEHDGVVLNKSKANGELVRHLNTLFKARSSTRDVAEQQTLTQLIHATLAEAGYPVSVEPPQQELGLQ